MDHNKIYESLGRLEGKMDLIVNKHEDFDTRLGVLENFKSWIVGGFVFIGTGLTWVLGLKHD